MGVLIRLVSLSFGSSSHFRARPARVKRRAAGEKAGGDFVRAAERFASLMHVNDCAKSWAARIRYSSPGRRAHGRRLPCVQRASLESHNCVSRRNLARPALPSRLTSIVGATPPELRPGSGGRSAAPCRVARQDAMLLCGKRAHRAQVRDNRGSGRTVARVQFNGAGFCPKGVEQAKQSVTNEACSTLLRTRRGESALRRGRGRVGPHRRRIREASRSTARTASPSSAAIADTEMYLLGLSQRSARNGSHRLQTDAVHGVAEPAYKQAFGDRSPNRGGHPQGEVEHVAAEKSAMRADTNDNSGECAMRRRADSRRSRMTPITRTPISTSPFARYDIARFRRCSTCDRAGLVPARPCRGTTPRKRGRRRVRQGLGPSGAGELTGVHADAIEKAELISPGRSRRGPLHARGIRHHSKGRENASR